MAFFVGLAVLLIGLIHQKYKKPAHRAQKSRGDQYDEHDDHEDRLWIDAAEARQSEHEAMHERFEEEQQQNSNW